MRDEEIALWPLRAWSVVHKGDGADASKDNILGDLAKKERLWVEHGVD